MDEILNSNKIDKVYKVVLSLEKKFSGFANMVIEILNDMKDIKAELHDHERRIENLENKNIEED